MGKYLQNLAQRIKEQISKEIVPITVIGKRGTGKTSLLWLVERSVRPALWHHDGLTDKMKSKFAKQMDADELFEKMLDSKVFLDLYVRVKENWRDSGFNISDFGFKEEE